MAAIAAALAVSPMISTAAMAGNDTHKAMKSGHEMKSDVSHKAQKMKKEKVHKMDKSMKHEKSKAADHASDMAKDKANMKSAVHK